jgi:hypothetical protein
VLVYAEVEVWTGRSASEQEALEAAFRDSNTTLRQSRYLIAVKLLAPEERTTMAGSAHDRVGRGASDCTSAGSTPIGTDASSSRSE